MAFVENFDLDSRPTISTPLISRNHEKASKYLWHSGIFQKRQLSKKKKKYTLTSSSGAQEDEKFFSLGANFAW